MRQICGRRWLLKAYASSNLLRFLHHVRLISDSLTFREVYMRRPVLRAVLGLEVPDEPLDALLRGRDEVDGLHGRQRLAVLVDRLHDGDALRREVLQRRLSRSRHPSPGTTYSMGLVKVRRILVLI